MGRIVRIASAPTADQAGRRPANAAKQPLVPRFANIDANALAPIPVRTAQQAFGRLLLNDRRSPNEYRCESKDECCGPKRAYGSSSRNV